MLFVEFYICESHKTLFEITKCYVLFVLDAVWTEPTWTQNHSSESIHMTVLLIFSHRLCDIIMSTSIYCYKCFIFQSQLLMWTHGYVYVPETISQLLMWTHAYVLGSRYSVPAVHVDFCCVSCSRYHVPAAHVDSWLCFMFQIPCPSCSCGLMIIFILQTPCPSRSYRLMVMFYVPDTVSQQLTWTPTTASRPSSLLLSSCTSCWSLLLKFSSSCKRDSLIQTRMLHKLFSWPRKLQTCFRPSTSHVTLYSTSSSMFTSAKPLRICSADTVCVVIRNIKPIKVP